MKKLSVVIVNHNTCELLDRCLSNLLKTNLLLEIIVVDNGSTDMSQDMLQQKYAGSVITVRDSNKGLSHGYNIGSNISTGDFILYLGTDAFPDRYAIEKLISYMEQNPDVGVCSPRLVLKNGSIDLDAHRGFPTIWAAFSHWLLLDLLFPKSEVFNQYYLGYKNFFCRHEVDACMFHFMLVRRKVMESVNRWDEDYFLFNTDIDYCFRIKKAGYRVMYLGDVEVLHFKGDGVRNKSGQVDTFSKKQKRKVDANIFSERMDALKLFYKKHLASRYPIFVNKFVYLGIEILKRVRIALAKWF